MNKRQQLKHSAAALTSRRFLVGGLCATMMSFALPMAVEAAGGGNLTDLQEVNQSKKVTGTVVDGAGEPLIGVSVQVKGTQIGAITDFDGKFSIDAPANATLVVSYVGFKTQEVKVGNQSVLAIRLEDDNQLLDEVVVIGYGTMKKRDLTGSITSVKAEDIVRSPASNAMEALQGQVPGLDITRNSGSATSGVTINIRGQRSLSDVEDEFQNNIANQPLFIVDGMQGVNFADIAPSDIESIEVLKDASSTAIYGSQGANGVIIITTKKGKAGKPRVSYNGYIGVNGWPQYPDMLMGEDYMNVRRESYRTAGQWSSTADDASIFTPNEWEAIQNGDWTNWVDEVFHTSCKKPLPLSDEDYLDWLKTLPRQEALNTNDRLRYLAEEMDEPAVARYISPDIYFWSIRNAISEPEKYTYTKGKDGRIQVVVKDVRNYSTSSIRPFTLPIEEGYKAIRLYENQECDIRPCGKDGEWWAITCRDSLMADTLYVRPDSLRQWGSGEEFTPSELSTRNPGNRFIMTGFNFYDNPADSFRHFALWGYYLMK